MPHPLMNKSLFCRPHVLLIGAMVFLFVLCPFISDNTGGGLSGDKPVLAQDKEVPLPADAPANEAKINLEPTRPSYLVWFITALGPIFAPAFALISVLFVMLVVMNWIALNRKNIAPSEMLEEFAAQLEEKKFQEAYETAKGSEAPLGKILAAGLARMATGYDSAKQAMSDVANEEIMRLEQRLGYIALIGGIAPMIGLLGTVVGMVQSFQVIAIQGTTPQASELAKGISTALITTEVGLFIAIPAMILYEIFRNKLALLVLEMGVHVENLMGRFSKKA